MMNISNHIDTMANRVQRKRGMSSELEFQIADDVRRSSDDSASDGGESEEDEATYRGGLSKIPRGIDDLADPEDDEEETERISKR